MAAKDFKIRTRRGTFPVTLAIDGYAIEATVTRLTIDEYGAFMRGFSRTQDQHADRLVSMRVPGEEQERRELAAEAPAPDADALGAYAEAVALYKDDRLTTLLAAYQVLVAAWPRPEAFVIGDAEIRRRRLVEMTAAERAAYERQRDDDETFSAAFIAEMLTKHLRILPGQIVEEDPETGEDHEITSGADFVRLYGARREVLGQALALLYRENTLSEAAKNGSSSPRASQTSSHAREPITTPERGPSPEAPAPNAGSEPSVTNATATASNAATSSGSMAAATA